MLRDGRRQEFQGGTIFYSPVAGTHNIQGSIRDKYRAMGSETSYLGYPTTDEVITPDGKGRYNFFQNGAIYWSAATGAHPVTSPVLDYWSDSGYEQGGWKYPIAGPVGQADSDTISQKFQGGTITVKTLVPGRIDAGLGDKHCFFYTRSDLPHLSQSYKNGERVPATVSAHGYWEPMFEGACEPGVTGDITAQLQIYTNFGWQNRGELGVKRHRYGNSKSANRAPANYLCVDTFFHEEWRVEVDVDINDYEDPPGKLYSEPVKLPCR